MFIHLYLYLYTYIYVYTLIFIYIHLYLCLYLLREYVKYMYKTFIHINYMNNNIRVKI